MHWKHATFSEGATWARLSPPPPNEPKISAAMMRCCSGFNDVRQVREIVRENTAKASFEKHTAFIVSLQSGETSLKPLIQRRKWICTIPPASHGQKKNALWRINPPKPSHGHNSSSFKFFEKRLIALDWSPRDLHYIYIYIIAKFIDLSS